MLVIISVSSELESALPIWITLCLDIILSACRWTDGRSDKQVLRVGCGGRDDFNHDRFSDQSGRLGVRLWPDLVSGHTGELKQNGLVWLNTAKMFQKDV